MRILLLAQRVPYPPNRGDKITTWRLIERMKREHDVTVIAFAHDEADLAAARTLAERGFHCIAVPHRERVKKLLSLPLLLTTKPLTLGVYSSRALQAEVDRHVAEADVAYAYSSSMGAFLLPHRIPWVMHFAELDSDKWRQYSRRKGFPMRYVYEREWLTLLAFERKLAAAARTNVFCTPLEEAVFQRDVPGWPSVVLRNGVDLEYYRPGAGETEPGHLVFVGVMDYYPNVDGCVHFVREILPRVRERHPKARFTIVGSRPSREVERLAEEPGVEVTGFVDDTREYLRKAAVSVAPLRIARGIQNKVLEALAMGLPVVGTESATQGVDGQPGRDYVRADSAEDQARAISELLSDPEKARKLGQRGRRLVEANYDWDVTLAPLDDILTDCLQPAPGTES
ncbi:MAG: TIGR03087 family PEP-CTERM/XrtA system glycosyltransferase [Planctomycetota bacterium]|nr:MAG: TIGR03087 family PEP-CTERM/XrtA system glycosyltransferase [Planctomycetota bacterium]